MIDLSLLRENPEMFTAALKKKDPSFDVNVLLSLDKKVRSIRSDVESLRSQKNELAKKGREGITPELRAQSAAVSDQLKNKENELVDVEQAFQELYLRCPNIPDASVPEGTVEYNLVERYNGTKPTYDFPLKNHVELGESLGWLDFEAATQLAGANFALYKGDGVKLLYALAMFMLKHNNKRGFDFVLPSVLLNEKSFTCMVVKDSENYKIQIQGEEIAVRVEDERSGEQARGGRELPPRGKEPDNQQARGRAVGGGGSDPRGKAGARADPPPEARRRDGHHHVSAQ